jgi:hypothetical protein
VGNVCIVEGITAPVRSSVSFACDGVVLHFLEGKLHHSPEVLDVSVGGYVAPCYVVFSNTVEPGYTVYVHQFMQHMRFSVPEAPIPHFMVSGNSSIRVNSKPFGAKSAIFTKMWVRHLCH